MEKVVTRQRFNIIRQGDEEIMKEAGQEEGVLERIYISVITRKGDLKHLPYIDVYLN